MLRWNNYILHVMYEIIGLQFSLHDINLLSLNSEGFSLESLWAHVFSNNSDSPQMTPPLQSAGPH
jgi:hypothetical protein